MAGNTDGQVVIKVDLSSNDAEKELSRLKKRLLSLEEDLTVGQHKKDALTQKLDYYKKVLKSLESETNAANYAENMEKIQETKAAISATEKEIEKQNKYLEDTQMTLDGVKLRYEEVKALAAEKAAAEKADAEKASEEQPVQPESEESAPAERAARAEEESAAAAEQAARAEEEKADAAERAARAEEESAAAAEQAARAESASVSDTGGATVAQEMESANQGVTRMQAAFAHIKEQLKNCFDLSEAKKNFKSILQLVGRIAGGLAKIPLNVVKKGVSAIASGLKSSVSHIGKIFMKSKSVSGAFGGIGSAVKQIAPALIASEGVIGILRKAVNAYMQQNQQLANTLSGAWTGLGNILGPVIDRMVSLLANAIAYFTKFLNLLGFTGKTAAKQIGNAGGAAKKESDELKKQLMSFDELNILQDNESDSGGGSGGSADTGITPNVQLPDWAKLMAEQLRSAQWSEAATTLTTALNNMVDSVDWGGIGAKIGFWLNGAMSFLATTINTFDWQGLGGRLATAVNNLISSVDWSNLGTILAGKFKIVISTMAGFILNLDMVELSHAASNIVISFFNTITDSITNTDWYAIGERIKTFLVSIDWSGIAEAVANAAGAAVGAFFSLVKGFFDEAWENLVNWWNETAYEDGQFTIEGLLNGIWDAVKDIGTWIYEHIFKPFADGFCDAFGIHSPSTVAAGWGGYIIAGLLNGITGAWQRVKDWFSNALSDIRQAFSDAWTSIRNTTANIWNGIVDTIRGAVNGVISVINRMISTVVNGINNLFSLLSFNISLPGGHSIGLSLPQFSAPQIPYLAQGAVIPPNAPFAAVLGDQRHGNNIEAPEDLIRKIVREEAAGGASNDEIVALLRELIEVVMGIKIGDETIGKAALRYTRRYNRAMGV